MHTTRSRSSGGWRRGTAAGAVLAGMTLGVRHAMEEEKERPAVVVDARAELPWPPRALEAHLLPGAPTLSWVVVRPWLLDGAP